MTPAMTLTSRAKLMLGNVRIWFLNHAEFWAYDLIGLPMALRHHDKTESSAAWLHDFFARRYWRLPWGPVKGLIMAVLWPFALAGALIIFTRWNGFYYARQRGLTRAQLAKAQAVMATRHAIAPFWFFMFELYDPARTRKAGLYLTAHEVIGAAFGALQPRENSDELADKVWFAKYMADKNIRAVPVFLYLTAGQVQAALSQETSLPPQDLFVKPRQGNGGHNAARYDHVGNGVYRSATGELIARETLLRQLLLQSLKQDFIVQPRLVNHRALSTISNDALSTVRVLTIRNEKGFPEATNFAFRMAMGENSTVDNFHQGGLATVVDAETGMIGEASNIGVRPEVGWLSVHPNSGVTFKGMILPDWAAVVALAVAAHQAFPQRIMVGWDVAMLADGPMIIEGNGRPDLDIHQRVERRPLGDQRVADLIVFNLKHHSGAKA